MSACLRIRIPKRNNDADYIQKQQQQQQQHIVCIVRRHCLPRFIVFRSLIRLLSSLLVDSAMLCSALPLATSLSPLPGSHRLSLSRSLSFSIYLFIYFSVTISLKLSILDECELRTTSVRKFQNNLLWCSLTPMPPPPPLPSLNRYIGRAQLSFSIHGSLDVFGFVFFSSHTQF